MRGFTAPLWLACLAWMCAGVPLPAQTAAIEPEQCREHILPDEGELAWRAVPWRTTFVSAVLEADQQDRPVLLWAMNGHPLGCT